MIFFPSLLKERDARLQSLVRVEVRVSSGQEREKLGTVVEEARGVALSLLLLKGENGRSLCTLLGSFVV